MDEQSSIQPPATDALKRAETNDPNSLQDQSKPIVDSSNNQLPENASREDNKSSGPYNNGILEPTEPNAQVAQMDLKDTDSVTPSQEPERYLADFVSLLSSLKQIPEDQWSTANDETSNMIELALRKASPSYWTSAPPDEVAEFGKQIRQWMVVLIKKQNTLPLLPVLKALLALNISDQQIIDAKLVSPIKFLFGSAGSLGAKASELSRKFPEAFKNTVRKAPAPPAHTPKLFGSNGALKLNSHKRSKPESSDQSSIDESPSTPTEPKPKKNKARKTVHWKPDEDLVEIQFYEINGAVKFKSSKNARIHEQREGSAVSQVVWHIPSKLEFNSEFEQNDFRDLMSISRGGHLDASKDTDNELNDRIECNFHDLPKLGEPGFEESDSPAEPPAFESEPESDWTPKVAGAFKNAQVPLELMHKYPQQTTSPMPMAMPPMNFMPPMTSPLTPMGGMPPMGQMPMGMPGMPAMPGMPNPMMGWMGMGYQQDQNSMPNFFNMTSQSNSGNRSDTNPNASQNQN